MLEGGGFEVIDLGTDVSPEKFVQAVKDRNPNLVCLSALLTVTMPSMKTTIDALKTAGMREKVRVVVGGAPVTEQWAKEIGADAYGGPRRLRNRNDKLASLPSCWRGTRATGRRSRRS
jgi:5-methyltetrahydrofolate--homocysteine methyltransferase